MRGINFDAISCYRGNVFADCLRWPDSLTSQLPHLDFSPSQPLNLLPLTSFSSLLHDFSALPFCTFLDEHQASSLCPLHILPGLGAILLFYFFDTHLISSSPSPSVLRPVRPSFRSQPSLHFSRLCVFLFVPALSSSSIYHPNHHAPRNPPSLTGDQKRPRAQRESQRSILSYHGPFDG